MSFTLCESHLENLPDSAGVSKLFTKTSPQAQLITILVIKLLLAYVALGTTEEQSECVRQCKTGKVNATFPFIQSNGIMTYSFRALNLCFCVRDKFF